jgi:hypothetical protein
MLNMLYECWTICASYILQNFYLFVQTFGYVILVWKTSWDTKFQSFNLKNCTLKFRDTYSFRRFIQFWIYRLKLLLIWYVSISIWFKKNHIQLESLSFIHKIVRFKVFGESKVFRLIKNMLLLLLIKQHKPPLWVCNRPVRKPILYISIYI